MSLAEIAADLGISKPTVCYHKRKLGYEMNDRCASRFDWVAIQRHYDEGHSLRQCIARFGFSRGSWHAAVKRGAIIPRPQAMPLEELLRLNQARNRHHVKRRLIRAGLKKNRCEECGIYSWRGEPLSLALHHLNGDGHDNRLENLVLLCPNCHSQTPNFGVKGWKSGERPSAAAAVAGPPSPPSLPPARAPAELRRHAAARSGNAL